MSNPFETVSNVVWHALRSVAHYFVRHPSAVLGVVVSEAGYWILWPILNGQPVELPRATAAAFIAFSSGGILTAINLLRATLKPRGNRRGDQKGSVTVDARVEASAPALDALNTYQERRYRGEE